MRTTPPDPRSPTEPWDQQFQELAAQPLVWLLKAQALIAARDSILAADQNSSGENTQGLHDVSYMLAGFAIENLLKGTLVACESPFNDSGTFKFKTHDLRELAQNAGYHLDEPDNRLLERIQEYAIWAGRYPTPLASEALYPRPTPGGGYAPRTYRWRGEDLPAIAALLKRFAEGLRERAGITLMATRVGDVA